TRADRAKCDLVTELDGREQSQSHLAGLLEDGDRGADLAGVVQHRRDVVGGADDKATRNGHDGAVRIPEIWIADDKVIGVAGCNAAERARRTCPGMDRPRPARRRSPGEDVLLPARPRLGRRNPPSARKYWT